MLKRRSFLIFTSILGLSSYLNAGKNSKFDMEFKKVKLTIASVQEHMFPKGGLLPYAKDIKATQFLYETINHKSYDRDIKQFIIDGANEFIRREGRGFASMTESEKEKALRSYEESKRGQMWLNWIMTLTMEAMFSDPIYGSNIKEIGWSAIDSYGGYPRANKRYIWG